MKRNYLNKEEEEKLAEVSFLGNGKNKTIFKKGRLIYKHFLKVRLIIKVFLIFIFMHYKTTLIH